MRSMRHMRHIKICTILLHSGKGIKRRSALYVFFKTTDCQINKTNKSTKASFR